MPDVSIADSAGRSTTIRYQRIASFARIRRPVGKLIRPPASRRFTRWPPVAVELIRPKEAADNTARQRGNATKSNYGKPVHSRARDLAQTIVKRLAAHPELADEFNSVVGSVEPERGPYWSTGCPPVRQSPVGCWHHRRCPLAGADPRRRRVAAERVKQERGRLSWLEWVTPAPSPRSALHRSCVLESAHLESEPACQFEPLHGPLAGRIASDSGLLEACGAASRRPRISRVRRGVLHTAAQSARGLGAPLCRSVAIQRRVLRASGAERGRFHDPARMAARRGRGAAWLALGLGD